MVEMLCLLGVEPVRRGYVVLRCAALSFAFVVAPILIWIIVIMAALAFGGLLFRAVDL